MSWGDAGRRLKISWNNYSIVLLWVMINIVMIIVLIIIILLLYYDYQNYDFMIFYWYRYHTYLQIVPVISMKTWLTLIQRVWLFRPFLECWTSDMTQRGSSLCSSNAWQTVAGICWPPLSMTTKSSLMQCTSLSRRGKYSLELFTLGELDANLGPGCELSFGTTLG